MICYQIESSTKVSCTKESSQVVSCTKESSTVKSCTKESSTVKSCTKSQVQKYYVQIVTIGIDIQLVSREQK